MFAKSQEKWHLQLKNEINGKDLTITEVDVLGNKLPNGSVQIKAFESKFLKVGF